MQTAVPDTLPDLIALQARLNGDAIAVIDGDRALTFGDLETSATGIAAGLAAKGISRGDAVAIWLPNSHWWLTALLAVARLGAVCVCVNTRFRAAELTDILMRSSAKALIYAPHFGAIDFAAIFDGVDDDVLARLSLQVTCGSTGAGARPGVPIEELSGSSQTLPPAPKSDDPVIMFTTSGTTSLPKFVLHDHASLALHADNVASGFAYRRPGTMLLQALPLCGTFGLAQALAALAAGAPSVVLPTFDADMARDLIAHHRVTGFNGTDEMFKRLLDGAAPGGLASIGWCGFACFAEARPAEFVSDCEARGLKLTGLYGMSEVQALYARQPEDLPAIERAQAGGALTSPDAMARVCDPHTGEDLAPGQSGELQLRGPSLFREYFNNPEASQAAITADGFVRTGDLAHMTEDGRFVFETRMGDSLRLGGFLVSPSEIDAWLEHDVSVAASQTVAVEIDGRMRPVSFIIPATGTTPDEQGLIAGCRNALARFKVPARIMTLDEFPTTDGPNGRKIQRGKLRDMARDYIRS
jgi:fatty-acyl-CoA synthase